MRATHRSTPVSPSLARNLAPARARAAPPAAQAALVSPLAEAAPMDLQADVDAADVQSSASSAGTPTVMSSDRFQRVLEVEDARHLEMRRRERRDRQRELQMPPRAPDGVAPFHPATDVTRALAIAIERITDRPPPHNIDGEVSPELAQIWAVEAITDFGNKRYADGQSDARGAPERAMPPEVAARVLAAANVMFRALS